MDRSPETKSVLLADLIGPEREVLTAVLDRLGYQVDQVDSISELKERLAGPCDCHVVILRAKLAGEDALGVARALGSPDRRVILIIDEPPPGGEMVGFVDLTENALLAMGVRVPEVVFAVNDLIYSRKGAPRRKKRIYGGFPVAFQIEGKWVTAGIYNLSSEGAFIETLDPPPTDTEIPVRFSLPGQNEMELRSRVTWRVEKSQTAGRRSPPGMGVHFLDMTSSQVDQIQEFVRTGGRT